VAKENEQIRLIVKEPTQKLNQDIIGPINQEGVAKLQLVYRFSLIQCYHSVRKHMFSFAQDNLFPVADILKEGRIGGKGDTGEEIIVRLKAVDFLNK
jgi:hypothetical protein